MTKATMAAGLALLGTAFNRVITKNVSEVYEVVLGAELTELEWETAVRKALKHETSFPAPATLLKYAKPAVVVEARAMEVFEQILASYADGSGGMSQRRVRDEFGTPARDAFMAAGGEAAFSWCEVRDEPFRRKRFVDAYVLATRHIALNESDPGRRFTDGEARKLLEGK